MSSKEKRYFTVRCSCQLCSLRMSYKRYVDDPDHEVRCEHCDGVQVSKLTVKGTPQITYNRSGSLKKTESFTDRMREISKNVPAGAARDSISEHIY